MYEKLRINSLPNLPSKLEKPNLQDLICTKFRYYLLNYLTAKERI